MAFVDAGYDGTVDEVQFAKLLNRYAVVGADDFKASNTTGDRMLSIANGTALGPGSLNVGSGFAPIQFEAVTSGTSRWDLVVLRRDWQPPGGNTSIAIVKGNSGTALPARNTTPGVIDDQPLYFQQVLAGSTSLGARRDLRLWVGPGGAQIVDGTSLQYLGVPGAQVTLENELWRFQPGTNGVWGWRSTLIGVTGWLDPVEFGNSFRPFVGSGWNSVKYRVTNGVAHLSGAVRKDLAEVSPFPAPAGTPMLKIPQEVAPSRRTPGIGCVVEVNGNVTCLVEVGPGGAVSMSASWPVEVPEV